MRPSLDVIYMQTAVLFGFRSTCDRGKIGAVLVKDGRIVSSGYTGSPAGTPHCDSVGHLIDKKTGGCVRTLHAEANCIAQAAKKGISLEGSTLFVTMSPCLMCAKLILASGIKKLEYLEPYRDASGTQFLINNGVEVIDWTLELKCHKLLFLNNNFKHSERS